MNPEAIADMLAAAAACRAAARCGVLSALANRGAPTELDRLGLDSRRLGVLLEALGAVGVVERRGPADWQANAAMVRAIQRAENVWDGLEQWLRSGRASVRSDEADSAAANYPDVVADLEALWGAAPSLLARQLTGVGRRVLDLGAGTAVWSRALLAADPARRAVAVDLEPVLDVARKALAEAGLSSRMDLVVADLLSESPPSGCDLVLLANVCHLFSTDVLGELFVRIEATAAPGATVVVVDLFGDTLPAGPTAALYALSLAVRTASGGLHSFATYARLLHKAGFGRIERVTLDERLSTVRARKDVAVARPAEVAPSRRAPDR